MIELTNYQNETSSKAVDMLKDKKRSVLNGEMRTGKTLIAIDVANKLCGNTLFVTKKNAIESIESDIEKYKIERNFICNIEVINYESLHKVKSKSYDLIIVDEYHAAGYIQKTKLINKRLNAIRKTYFLGMTGTLFLETFSTAYSLFPWCFPSYRTFYKWAHDYVNITMQRKGQNLVPDYTKVKDMNMIWPLINPYIITLTQKDAGFVAKVEDIVHRVESRDLSKLCEIIKKKKLYQFKDGSQIVADNMSKEFQIIKQLQSGTLLMSTAVVDGRGLDEFKYLDDFKCQYIINNFMNYKFAVFYEFRAERFMIMASLARAGYEITEDAQYFNKSGNKVVYIGQFVSKREGVNLSGCDDLIFFCMPYSNLSYIQARERAMTKDKTQEVRCHFLLTKFEERVYKTVTVDKGRFSSESYRQAVRFEDELF